VLLEAVIKVAYIAAAALFIFGLKYMGHPRTAVRGNLLGASGMSLAILVTLMDKSMAFTSPVVIIFLVLGVGIGSAIGASFALRVPMTDMPQLVALFNGFGGGASVFVAGAELCKWEGGMAQLGQTDALLATALSGLIGAVTFFGSLIAFAKLQELQAFKKPFSFDGQKFANLGLLLVALVIAASLAFWNPGYSWDITLYIFLCLLASALGVLLVSPIGGADMPVVIALLNSYSGLAAAATGFVIDNNVLIIAGSLVGASGLILTQLMCKAMNRSLAHVFFGVLGAGEEGPDADEMYATVRSSSADDVALMLDGAQRVMFVPGYGMAVAQAQHAVRDLAKMLEAQETKVDFAIHPVAGRMPGHMNVLLAEADVPYEQLKEMDDANAVMEQVDVAIVIGANDTVNPMAQTDPNCAIGGMPIIDVQRARTVVVIKRSLSPGFAGVPNPLFAADNAFMLFGDGQQAVLDIIAAHKEL